MPAAPAPAPGDTHRLHRRPDLPPAWLADFQVGTIFCGYDADSAGDRAAELLCLRHPGIRRLRPPHAKDWNQLLQNQS